MSANGPSPALFFDTINAYQKTAALKSAIELGVFTAIGKNELKANEIAAKINASERGTRMLADYLVTIGFLSKEGDRYSVTQDSAVFLDRNSPAYLGGTIEFLSSQMLVSSFDHLTETVRRGGNTNSKMATTAPEHAVWPKFARAMAPLMMQPASVLADLVKLDSSRTTKVLDISASHGAYGIAFAKKNPKAQIVACDWPNVLEVTSESARKAEIADRFSTIPGSAFDVDFGNDYDVILVPNFLHHFSVEQCVAFLKKAHASLRPGGCIAIVEFVPNEDRVTPPGIAGFGLIMLASTPEGDAYTFNELRGMLQKAGCRNVEMHSLPPSMNAAVLGIK